MKEPHTEGLATHGGPESCVGLREEAGEALTGGCAGTVLSREIRQFGVPTPLSEAEGNTEVTASARWHRTPRGRRPVARTQPFCARTGRSHVYLGTMVAQATSGRPEAIRR